MALRLLPIDRRWITEELTPYLRRAFKHVLPLNADISCQIESAIEFCMHKPDYPTDGDDHLFERICQAIQLRHLDLAPDLRVVTDNLEPLAKFLIRRAQLKGTYELLGRNNIASPAWREHEAARLEEQKGAAKSEGKGRLAVQTTHEQANATAVLPSTQSAPSEDKIDPRLVHSQPGHFVLPEDSGILTVDADSYYRHQNQLLVERRRYAAVLPTWQQQLQQAATLNPAPPVQAPNDGWSYDHAFDHQHQAPSLVQDYGQRHNSYAVQPHNTAAVGGHPRMTRLFSQQLSSIQPRQPLAPAVNTSHAAGPAQPKLRFAYQETPAQQQHHPIQPVTQQSMVYLPVDIFGCGSTTIPVADISHLRGREWAVQAEQRVHDFSELSQHEKAHELMYLNRAQEAPGVGPSIPQQAQHPLQQHLGYHQNPTAPSFAHAPQNFANHPGFSNIRSTFPNIHAMASMAPAQVQHQREHGHVTGLPFGTDSRWT